MADNQRGYVLDKLNPRIASGRVGEEIAGVVRGGDLVRHPTAEDGLAIRVKADVVLTELKNIAQRSRRLKANQPRPRSAAGVDVASALTGAGTTAGIVNEPVA